MIALALGGAVCTFGFRSPPGNLLQVWRLYFNTQEQVDPPGRPPFPFLFGLSKKKTNSDQAEPHYFPIMSRTKGFVTRTNWTRGKAEGPNGQAL